MSELLEQLPVSTDPIAQVPEQTTVVDKVEAIAPVQVESTEMTKAAEPAQELGATTLPIANSIDRSGLKAQLGTDPETLNALTDEAQKSLDDKKLTELAQRLLE